MTPAELNRMLDERRVPPLLLLYGEEGFLLERAQQRIRDLVVPPEGRDFNFHVFQGREARGETVLDAARTLPVFAPRRLVLVKDLQHLPAAELDSLLPYLRDPSPETVLLLTADKIDARRKFYQEFKKAGEMVEFRRLYDNQIPAFVREQARGAGYSFTEEGIAAFCRRVGNNLQEIHGELLKLFSYLGEKKLADAQDVTAVVSDTRADSIFDLTNAMGEKKTAEALKVLEGLLDEGVAPLVILTMMVRHFRNLWKISEMLERREGTGDIARRVGVNPYFVEGLTAQARRFSTPQYRSFFDRFLSADLALKSSGAHPSVLLESLVLEISRQP